MGRFGQEREREPDRGPDMDGEELVDGTGGGGENVSDVTRAGHDTGRKAFGAIVAIIAVILLAIPVAWALGALTILGTFGSPTAWLYVIVLGLVGLGAAWYAYWVMLDIRRATHRPRG